MTGIGAALGETSAELVKAQARIAELESLLRVINAKVIFENAVPDGSGADLQERVEQALGIGQSALEPKT